MPYAKKTDKETTRKQREYVKFKDLDRAVEVQEGDMWLQNGKYAQPGVSVAIDDEHTLSDWTRKIKLRNVCLDVVENDKGFPELVISGAASDLPYKISRPALPASDLPYKISRPALPAV